MRRVVNFVVIVVCATVVAQFGVAPSRAAAAPIVSMSQVIMPLQCSVDIIAVGSQVNVSLMPAECNRSSAARQLLAHTRASLGIQ